MKSPWNPAFFVGFFQGFQPRPGWPEAKYLVNYGTRALAQFASVERLLTLSQLQAEEARGLVSWGRFWEYKDLYIYISDIYIYIIFHS